MGQRRKGGYEGREKKGRWLVEELIVGEERSDCWRGFLRKAVHLEGGWNEGVGAMVQHLLGVVVGYRGGLDAKIAKHGVGFPAAKELDGILVDASAKKRSGPTRSKGAGGEKVEGHAGLVLDGLGSVAKGVGDVSRWRGVPRAVVGVRIVIMVDRRVRVGLVFEEAKGDPA